jgi:NodT family efflux transporter outer membrane factor (OMF) lipoprotein
MNGFIKRSAGLFALSAFVTGCAVGPNFHTPAAPVVNKYNAHPLPSRTASTASAKGNSGISQVYVYNRDIPAEWWQLFRSPAIDELVRTGMANSPNLASAQAALRQAEENLYAGIGNLLLPALNANMEAQRQRFATSTVGFGSSSTIFNLFNANAAVTYTLDIFGGSRREIESLRAQVDYQQFQLLATYLTLTSNIVTTAFTIASLEAQISSTESIIQSENGQLNILQKQLRLGGIANTSVLTQQTLVDQTRASLPPLQKLLSQSRHALATLIGVYPDTPMPTINLNSIKLPTEIPVSLPSELVRQRPDIRSSEALLHVASAQIGVATANLFPQISISGNDGWTNSIASSLFQPGSKTWAMAGQLMQPIFHGGALFAQRRAAIAAYDQALAQYKQTILLAFQNTADSLRALETDARTYRASRAAEMSAYKNFRITRSQFRDGGVAYINLLNAQQQYQQTRIASIQAQAMRYADVAALYQSLGGGWWNRKYIQCPDKQINPEHATLNCP